MRKIIIYISAFVISFILIYSFYYYSQYRYLSGGFVAQADTLRNTVMRPHPYQPSLKKNQVFSAGLLLALHKAHIPVQVAGADEIEGTVNARAAVVYCGNYSEAALNSMDQELQSRFPKHPPLRLDSIKNGEKFLFSYVFRNAELPHEFTELPAGISFGAGPMMSLLYIPEPDPKISSEGIKFYVSGDKKHYALSVGLDGGDEVIWYHADSLQTISDAFRDARSVITTENLRAPNKEERIILPMVDVFLTRTYRPANLESFFNPGSTDFKRIEDRIKLKTSATSSIGRKGRRVDEKTRGVIVFNNSCLFCIRHKGASMPYAGILFHNGELMRGKGQ